VIDLSGITGCFPDVRCMASVVVPQGPDISFDLILWFFGALAVLALVLGFLACNMKGKE